MDGSGIAGVFILVIMGPVMLIIGIGAHNRPALIVGCIFSAIIAVGVACMIMDIRDEIKRRRRYEL